MEGSSITHPPMLDNGNYLYWKMQILKPEVEWTNEEERVANAKYNATFAIFCGIDMQDFKHISNCIAFDLGEVYSNSKLVTKVLQSLSERFFVKVTAIEEAKDMKSLKIDESIGSLQTFELNLDESKKVKSKGESNIALQVADEMPIPNAFTIEKLQVHIALLTQNFNKAFKK
ncbi:hypothetical protein CXB51_021635 [Gossypium anomalum]|uniref:Uncharacterized protein n=1 Tax=Gossypium anomalum TaxID=47600 RepID=A0A8J6CS62_9ROSI|nr:hypothetical protein CXB51_021635 [Gossypium anomalum]